MDEQIGPNVLGMVYHRQEILEDMICPLPPTMGIRLVYSCYFVPKMSIGRVNEFQGLYLFDYTLWAKQDIMGQSHNIICFHA